MLAWVEHHPGLAAWIAAACAVITIIVVILGAINRIRKYRKERFIQWRSNLSETNDIYLHIINKIDKIHNFLNELVAQNEYPNIILNNFKIKNLVLLKNKANSTNYQNKKVICILKEFYSDLIDYESNLVKIIDETRKYPNENKRWFGKQDKELLQEKINICKICAEKLEEEFKIMRKKFILI